MNGEYRPVSIGNWIITFILLSIPLVNLIMLIVWAVSISTHPSKRTFAQACWVLFAIYFCIGVLVALILPAVGYHYHIHPPAQTTR